MKSLKIIKEEPFEIEIYHALIIVCSIEKPDERFVGRVDCDEDGVIYVSLFMPEITTGIIVHESIHVAYNVFHNKGIYCNPDNHEHFAYLVEYVFNKISKIIENFK